MTRAKSSAQARSSKAQAGVSDTHSTVSRHFEGPAKARTRKPTKETATAVAASDSEAGAAQEKDDSEQDAYEDANDGEDEDEKELDSDALDDDSEDEVATKKRKRNSGAKGKSPVKKKASPRKKRRTDAESDEDDEVVLKEGQEVVGVVVQAPKTGRVPPGQISRNTFNFLAQLKKPEYNDREWFKLNEPVYRLAEKEWKDFIDEFTPLLIEADPQIPHLPPKDVIHRIYRDVRFSNDKTPYKTGFSASFSRSGRKGIFAHYHIVVRPGDSLIAAGAWQPGKNELQTIRNNILRSSRRLRGVLSAPAFVRFFGEAHAHPKGERQSIFGLEDELKKAPKGVDKDHADIDLLKCRTFAVVHRFTDCEVLSPDFKEVLCSVVEVLRPFVHCLNDLMTIQDADSDPDEEEEDGEDEDSDEE